MATLLIFSMSGCESNIFIPKSQPAPNTPFEPPKNMTIDPYAGGNSIENTTIEPFNEDDGDENIINGGDIEMITTDDLAVVYSGVLINKIRPFSDIVADLGIVLDAEDLLSNGTIERIASTDVDGITYYIRNYHYPNADKKDITIQYVFDENLQESWIVSISLLGSNIATKRGVKVGDREERMLQIYGGEQEPAYSNEKSYSYYLNPDINFSGITFIADNDTGLITKIYIDYAQDETFDRLDIIALDGIDIRE